MGMKILNLGIYSSLPSEEYGGIDENTVLMLHCNGADESTVFTDASPSEHGNANVVGTARVDTTNKKWGTGSLELDGDSDSLNYDNSNDWDFATNTTIDFWVKMTNHDGAEAFISQYENATNYWSFYHVHGFGWKLRIYADGSEIIEVAYGTEIIDTDWHHIALIKVGSLYGIYVDGTQGAYKSDADMDTFTGSLVIGQKGDNAWHYHGYIDEIRIQHSNIFNANPNDTPDDTIDIPTQEYSE